MAYELTTGRLAREGLLAPSALDRAAEILAEAQDAGLETIRVLFADQHGILRGKVLVLDAFEGLFRSGLNVPSTLLLKDTSHRTAFAVWGEGGAGPADTGDAETAGAGFVPMRGAGDVLLLPRPETFRILPWSPHSAWILCDTVQSDGAPIRFSSSHVLRQAEAELDAQGLQAIFGLEVEFQIFERLDAACTHSQSSMPGAPVETRNLTQGYQYLTETRYSDCEAVLDLIRRNAQGLGLQLRSVEIEMGPSQFEFTFAPLPAMQQADAMVMFRTMVKEVCARAGFHASFMAKPRLENAMANGWHLHQSLIEHTTKRNLFEPNPDGSLSSAASGWIAGLLKHAAETSVLIAPTVNSYKRYQPFQLAPNRIQWGRDNRGAMLRGLMQPGDSASRIENRAPDSSANPYFAIAAQILAGSAGMAAGLSAPAPTTSPYEAGAALLPRSLGQALDAFEDSAFLRSALGVEFVSYLSQLKRAEWERYLNTVSEWEQAEYFNLF
ncbi:Glutamine synthetase [Phaeobacter sp. CECT 5382]|uniref:glutamine synthetase family protein n=1 Tax=Phaeobacter sp. CECT 5382 TaxID=1712645 RepID=UPI0006DA24B6|nr:glutamine synthetase family protein [Phaeobacter sp. CECT 5382]CUH87539.1 Glutamine synthetase [Phaeobacter sp. CECT 5382]